MSKARSGLSSALLGILSALGCGDASSADRSIVGDTIVVSNRLPLRDTARLASVQRYGVFDGSPETVFTSIKAFAVDENGSVYISDRGRDIRQFDRQGAFVRWVARFGDGPAEVRYVVSLAARNGVVAAHDWGRRRVVTFSENAEPSPTAQFPFRPRWYAEDALTFAPDGLWLGLGLDRSAGDGSVARPVFGLVGADGSLEDTVHVVDPQTCAPEGTPMTVGFWDDKREPFLPTLKWARGPDGSMAVGCPHSYAFNVKRADGTVLRIERDWVPVPIPPEARRYWMVQEHLPSLPDHLPAFARLIVPGDGRVWVWPSQPMVEVEVSESDVARVGPLGYWSLGERGAFDVFDREGTWVGSVKLPEELHYSGYATEPPLVIRGDTLWGVTVDEFNVESVTRYEISWP